MRSQVEEVLFMNKLTVEDLKITLQMKIAEVDRRIQSGRYGTQNGRMRRGSFKVHLSEILTRAL